MLHNVNHGINNKAFVNSFKLTGYGHFSNSSVYLLRVGIYLFYEVFIILTRTKSTSNNISVTINSSQTINSWVWYNTILRKPRQANL